MLDFAYSMLKAAYNISPTHYIASFNMGVILGKLAQTQKAMAYYEKSLSLNPQYSYTYLNLAILYKDAGNTPKGIDILTEGITANPDEGFLYYNRCCFYALLNKRLESKQDLEKSIALYHRFLEYARQDKDLEEIVPLIDPTYLY